MSVSEGTSKRDQTGLQKTTFDQIRQIFIMGQPKSGKSTFFNQLKRIYSDEREMDKTYVEERKEMIKLYIFHAIAEIVNTMPKLSPPIRLESLTSQALATWFIYYAKLNFNVDKNKVVVFFHFLRFFKILWEDEGFQSALNRSAEYEIPHHAKYFFSHIDRIFDQDYIPTEEDILKGYIFPSTTQKLEIEYIDIERRNANVRRRLASDMIEIKAESVNYRIIDLGDKIDESKCLSCLYHEAIKHDMDYVPWFQQRPKFTNYSIIFIIDGSSEQKRKEGVELLKSIVHRYNCCCFMISPVVNKWDLIVKDDDNCYNLHYEFKDPIFDGFREIDRKMCPQYSRKSREWIVQTTTHDIFISALNADSVKEVFETCCGDIELIEVRTQFEEQFRSIKKNKDSGLLYFTSDTICAGLYKKDEN